MIACVIDPSVQSAHLLFPVCNFLFVSFLFSERRVAKGKNMKVVATLEKRKSQRKC